MRRAAGGELGSELRELAQSVHDLTKGNAFLVCELWRTFVETGAAGVASPESVREVVSQRLARLTPATQDLLELAATAGSEFELDIVGARPGSGSTELHAALDEAVRSGMLEELPSHGSRTASRTSSCGERCTTGCRACVAPSCTCASALRSRAAADVPAAHSPISRTTSPPPGPSAGRTRVSSTTCWLRVRPPVRSRSTRRRRDSAPRSSSGSTSRGARGGIYRRSAMRATGREGARRLRAFMSAAEIARELGDAQLLARAAIGYEDACWRPGMTDQGAVELLELAAEALGDETSELRVGLLGGLARALDFQGDYERGAIVRASAIAMARELRDRVGLATILMRSYWSLGASTLEEILEMVTESRDLGEELGNTEIRAEAMAWRTPIFVALCDLESARREVAALRETAEQTAQPFMLHVAEHYASALALCDGRLDEAERAAMRSHDWSRLLTGRDPSGVFGIQMFSVRREQGRLAEFAPVIRILASESRLAGPWRPGLVAVLAELGMETEARRELGRIAAHGLERYRQSLWLTSLTYLADACTALRDDTMAALVYPELAPRAGGNVMIGHLRRCYGAADRYLGHAGGDVRRRRARGGHFERALESTGAMGAVTWLAHTAYEYGALPAPAATASGATTLLGEAATLAGRIGMPTLLGRIEALGAAAPASLPDGLSPREVQILALVARGLSNREIGSALTISEHTAANHIRSILRKTGCANRTEAASYAHKHRLASV